MTSSEELSHLLARCALNDRQAFERLYQETSSQLYGLVLRIVRNGDTANDVLQESYVKIWNRAGDFRADKAKPITWMMTIVRNQAIDSIRRTTNPGTTFEPVDELHWLAEDSPGPQELTSQSQDSEALHECIRQLENNQRRAMMLAYFDGLTHDELAQQLNTPLGTVKSWLRRGLLRLKKCLDEG